MVYVGERGGSFGSLFKQANDIDQSFQIFAGKFRRYHGESWLRRLLDIKTILLNTRDVLYVSLGFFQALSVLRRVRPDVIFLKGGFVGVPVGLAAKLYRTPIVTHDSDAVAGLANKLVSRWVTLHATAFPAEQYPYPPDRTRQVGVIVSKHYKKVDPEAKKKFRKDISVPAEAQLLLVTGGSSGSIVINKAVEELYDKLLNKYSNLYIIHQTGKGKAGEITLQHPERIIRKELLDDFYKYSGAADVIVMRAGANTLAEFGVQAKACIVIPSPFLPAGHQLENAQYLLRNEAVRLVEQASLEASGDVLYENIRDLLEHDDKRSKLEKNIHALATDSASKTIADQLLQLGDNKKKTLSSTVGDA